MGKTYKYSNDANYIIFRDIDLQNGKWEPIQFYGNMIGAKAAPNQLLWNADSTQLLDAERPVISNVFVSQDKKRNSDQAMGVGFFATIESKMMLTETSLSSPDPVIVKNLILENVSVSNSQTSVHHDVSIINGLLGALGAIVGTVLDVLLKPILGISFRQLLTNLLTARKADPGFYATGAFAGRIIGNAQVIGCEVRNVQVSNAKPISQVALWAIPRVLRAICCRAWEKFSRSLKIFSTQYRCWAWAIW